MVVFKNNGLSKKEESFIWTVLNEVNDPFSDVYLTRNNIRLFLRDNFDVFRTCLKQGDKIAISDSGFATLLGYSDNAQRKYLKVLVKDLKDVEALVAAIVVNISEDIYCKVKQNNPLRSILLSIGFEFLGGRGKEALLVKKNIK